MKVLYFYAMSYVDRVLCLIKESGVDLYHLRDLGFAWESSVNFIMGFKCVIIGKRCGMS
jgi:hypothetical protein